MRTARLLPVSPREQTSVETSFACSNNTIPKRDVE